jgi:cyclophilin family peptidyl-prolyl cis-trans isomerase/HEAT repeat protein
LGTAGAEEHLLAIVDAPAAEVRAAVAHALFRRRFAPRWRREVEVEPDASPAAAMALRRLLADPEVAPRRAAAHALSRLGDPGAIGALVPLLADADEWTRFFAARAIGRAADTTPATLVALAAAVADPSPLVRREAVMALVGLGAGDRVPPSAADDTAAQVRAAFAGALGTRPDPGAEQLLLRLEAEDPAPSVRAAALTALAGRDTGPARERLRARLVDPLAAVRSVAVAALAPLSPPLREELGAQLLADPDRSVRLRALEALGDLPVAAGAVAAALASSDIAERGTAVDLVAAGDDERRAERLRQAFANSSGVEWIELRETLVEALANDSELLLEASRDPAAAVRVRALAALRRAGHSAPTIEPTPPNDPSPFLESTLPPRPRVELQTSRGVFVIEGLADVAPLHVASLLALVDRGFYDGLTIHRVVPGFVVQGGDPRGDGWGGPEFQLRDEISRVPLERGMVGMAKAGKDTGGSQFFVTLAPTPHLDGNYTVYGRIVQGMEVVDQLEIGDRIERARRLTTPK